MKTTMSNNPYSPAAAILGTRSAFAGAILAAVFLLLSGCDLIEEGRTVDEGARKLVPEVYDKDSPADTGPADVDIEALESTPKVPLDEDEKLIQVLNTNLDLDANDEQILVVRQKNDPQGPLTVAVIDYDPVRAGYSRTWESLTNATNLRLLEITLKDVVGDHNLEIVCRGMNNQGELTLDLFRKTPSPTGLGLYFTEILRIVSDGSIEIAEIERSEGYRLGQKNGPSFVIYSFGQDRESDNLLDRIKRTYHWQYQQGRYVLTNVEKMPGAVVEEKQLKELFSDLSVEAFERFLAGPWYLADAEGRQEILLFLPDQRRISLYNGQVQEVYVWQGSYRSMSNRMLAFGTNESIESISKNFGIDVVSLKSIDVSIWGTEQWDRTSGRYIKLTEELQQDLLEKEHARIEVSSLVLEGLYKSGQGIEIIFDPPHFTWIEDSSGFSGGFTIIHLDQDVLYLQGIDENGLPTRSATYIMDYAENREGEYLYRNLTLVPGRMSVNGVQPASETRMVFEQLENLEEEETEGEAEPQ